MRTFITHIIVFITVVLLIFVCLNIIVGKYNTDPPHYKLQYAEAINSTSDMNCIILGTSKATHGIRPSLINTSAMKCYNFAYNGGNPEFYVKWYDNIFSRYHPMPKYCIIAYDWFFLETGWMWRKYEQDSEYFPFDVFVGHLIGSDSYDMKTLFFNIPIFKYRSLKDLAMLFFNNQNLIFKDYDNGFIAYQVPYYEKNYIHPLTQKPFTCNTCDVQKRYFEELIGKFQSQGIQVVFVNTPEFGLKKEHYKKIEEIQYFCRLAKKLNIPQLNYNIERRTSINENVKYFNDWCHLNAAGSYEFSKMLKEDLNSIIRNLSKNY